MDEMRKRDPLFDEVMAVDPAKFMALLIQTKHGPYVRVSTTFACKQCTPALERVVAKQPSWAIVDINKGPGPDKPIFQVG